MTERKYNLAMKKGHDPKSRTGHILTMEKDGFAPVDIAIHRTASDWVVDHPKSGTALGLLNVDALGGDIGFEEAKSMIVDNYEDMNLHGRIIEKNLPTLNEGFN